MSYLEKINIYVPEETGMILKNDARLFEILKSDMFTINMNRFLSMVLVGYYNEYQEAINKASNKVLRILKEEGINDRKDGTITNRIIKSIFEPQVPIRKGKKSIKLSLKPTKETENIINSIYDSLKKDDYISQYLCKLLISYCNKPLYERERVVFRDRYELLFDACKSGRSIMFSTIWNKETLHTVMPYKLVYGKEEMFNYLLCEEINVNTGKQETASYRLNRINYVCHKYSDIHLSKENKPYFLKMIKYGPQFAINEENKIVVRLNEKGKKSFNRIYYGRPEPTAVIAYKDKYDYHFECSETQIYLFFRRFEGSEAIIITPKSLRNKMMNFHKKAAAINKGE